MEEGLKELLAFIFQRKGSNKMSTDDFIYGPAADLGWFTSKEMRKILEIAQRSGLIMKDNESVKTNFDYSTVKIPLGFTPSKELLKQEVERSLFQRILDEIMATGSGLSKEEIISMTNKKQDSMNIEIEVALLLVARELELELPNESAYLKETEESILKVE